MHPRTAQITRRCSSDQSCNCSVRQTRSRTDVEAIGAYALRRCAPSCCARRPGRAGSLVVVGVHARHTRVRHGRRANRGSHALRRWRRRRRRALRASTRSTSSWSIIIVMNDVSRSAQLHACALIVGGSHARRFRRCPRRAHTVCVCTPQHRGRARSRARSCVDRCPWCVHRDAHATYTRRRTGVEANVCHAASMSSIHH